MILKKKIFNAHMCTRFTHLSRILRLFGIKERNWWTDRSFTKLLELLHEILPEGKRCQPFTMR